MASKRPVIPHEWTAWTYCGMPYRRRSGQVEVFAQGAWRPSVLFVEKRRLRTARRAA